MTPDEILEIDAKRNHPPGTVAGHLRADINQQIKKGGQVVRQGNTLIAFHPTAKGEVTYHTFNADTGENLAKHVVMFWDMLKKAGAKKATVYYRNEKVTQLFKAHGGAYKTAFTHKNGAIQAVTTLK